jgi:hypothetical protein
LCGHEGEHLLGNDFLGLDVVAQLLQGRHRREGGQPCKHTALRLGTHCERCCRSAVNVMAVVCLLW